MRPLCIERYDCISGTAQIEFSPQKRQYLTVRYWYARFDDVVSIDNVVMTGAHRLADGHEVQEREYNLIVEMVGKECTRYVMQRRTKYIKRLMQALCDELPGGTSSAQSMYQIPSFHGSDFPARARSIRLVVVCLPWQPH